MKRSITKTTDRKIYNSLKRWLDIANEDQKRAGLSWYKEAQDFAQYLSQTFNIDSYICAAVISALSPNNKWQRNKIDAFNVCQAFKTGMDSKSVKCCTYNANKEKAFAILSGDTSITSKSPKTHSFAMNVGLLSEDHVTVDKWHIRACLASPKEGICDTVEGCTPAQYRRIEAITVKLAKSYKMRGFEVQAIIWTAIKDNWGR